MPAYPEGGHILENVNMYFNQIKDDLLLILRSNVKSVYLSQNFNIFRPRRGHGVHSNVSLVTYVIDR